MKQINIYEELERINGYDGIKTKNELNGRQWRLHDFLKEHSNNGKVTHKQMLEGLDEHYGYTEEMEEHPNREFNNLRSRRLLSNDLDVITRNPTIQHVYTGGKYATNRQEAKQYILNLKISALKTLKKVSILNSKLALNGQQRLVFNQERDHWESILKETEQELEDL